MSFIRKKIGLLSVAVLLFLVSCQPVPIRVELTNLPKGLFILNEGNYTFANSSLTFYNPQTDTSADNLFWLVNESPIGDVGQSLALFDSNLYIVVNNSKYIYCVDACNLKFKAKLGNFSSPRHMLILSPEKAYVSDLTATGLWVINPSTMQHIKYIETGKSTEKMVQCGNEVWLVNWSAYYRDNYANNTVQIIDIEKDSLISEIVVGKEPNSIVMDKNNHIWVLRSGGYLNPEIPALLCINPTTRMIIKKFEFPSTWPTNYPSNLTIDAAGENLYFINSNVFKMNINDSALPTQFFAEVEQGGCFYNICVSPYDGDVYISDAKDYVSSGKIYRYDSTGTLKSSCSAGLIPGAMLFN